MPPAPPAEALARLGRMVDAGAEPALAGEDLAELLNAAARTDTVGRLPADPAWTPTYDFDAAAGDGWMRKAGRAAGAYNFAAGPIRSERAQVHQHCLTMAAHFRDRADAHRRGRRGLTSVPVRSATAAAVDDV